MIDREFTLLLDAFRRLIRIDARVNIKKMILKTHPADLALLFRSFNELERETVFNLIEEDSYKAEFLTELDRGILLDLVKSMTPKEIVELIDKMAQDDRADIVSELPDEVVGEVIKLMNKVDSENLQELMKYDPDSAGGIMVPSPFRISEDKAVKDVIADLQKSGNLEMVFYIYVVNSEDKLTGILSLRKLLTAQPETPVKDIMIRKVIKVRPETDQEEVARIISKYNLLALPVVDEDDRLIGIVTVDDIIDVIREETTEDFLRMAGVGRDREILLKKPVEAAKMRLPWLFATFIGGLIVSLVVIGFKEIISKYVILAAYMPIVAGMGGNVGSQSSTIVVRGLAIGRINFNQIFKVVLEQLKTGAILGLIYGLLLGGATLLLHLGEINILRISLSIGISLTIAMLLAATTGSLIPMILHRINIDPAVASGPFVTTIDDIIGVSVYYLMAILII